MLDGYVHPDFAGTAGRLLGQLPRRAPGGAALCVYFEGRCVVDVWGGTRDREGNPWLRETTAPSFSTTKGVVSTLIHRLVDEGCARYDEPIAQHWPAFAAQGKASITIRQALCHEAGLYRMSEMVQHPSESDWQHMLDRVAALDLLTCPAARMVLRDHPRLARGDRRGDRRCRSRHASNRAARASASRGSTSACRMLCSMGERGSFTTMVFPMPWLRPPVNSALHSSACSGSSGSILQNCGRGSCPSLNPSIGMRRRPCKHVSPLRTDSSLRARSRASTRCLRKARLDGVRVLSSERVRAMGEVQVEAVIVFSLPGTGASAITAYSASARTHRKPLGTSATAGPRAMRSDASPVGALTLNLVGPVGTCASLHCKRCDPSRGPPEMRLLSACLVLALAGCATSPEPPDPSSGERRAAGPGAILKEQPASDGATDVAAAETARDREGDGPIFTGTDDDSDYPPAAPQDCIAPRRVRTVEHVGNHSILFFQTGNQVRRSR